MSFPSNVVPSIEHSADPRIIVPLRDVLCVEVDDGWNETILHNDGAYLFPIGRILFEQQAYRF